MLRSIDWQSFLLILLSTAMLYYIIIFLLYYRKDAKKIIDRRKNQKNAAAGPTANGPSPIPGNSSTNNHQGEIREEEAQFAIAHSLGSKLKALIKEAATNKTVREEMMMSIQLILSQDIYRSMKGTPFAIAINNLIQYEAETQCSVHLSAEEVNGLWVR